jgi:hypothetical protein
MQIAARRHDLIPLSVSDPAEEVLPDLGLVLLEDAEGGDLMALDAGSSAVRDAWGASVQARLGARDRMLSRQGVTPIRVSTRDRDYAAPLLNYFRLRAKRA